MAGLWMRSRACAAAAAVVLAVVVPVQAQVAAVPMTTLVGAVSDSAGHPIPGVEVWVRGLDLFTHTNDAGGFRLASVPVGAVKLSLRRLGFAPATVDLKTQAGRIDSLVVALTEMASNRPGVLVLDEAEERSHRLLAGFWERRAHGNGHFITRREIEARNAHDFTDVLRMVPGIIIMEKNGRRVFRFSRNPGTRDCPPQFVVDGMRIENGSPDEFPPHDLEAVELYPSTATVPPQFAPRPNSNTCGAVVIWTRLPGG